MEEEKQPGESYKNITRPFGKILFYNFLGGVAWSLGTLVGLSIILAIVGFVLSRIDLIPIIGSWVAEIFQDATSKIQTPQTIIKQ